MNDDNIFKIYIYALKYGYEDAFVCCDDYYGIDMIELKCKHIERDDMVTISSNAALPWSTFGEQVFCDGMYMGLIIFLGHYNKYQSNQQSHIVAELNVVSKYCYQSLSL